MTIENLIHYRTIADEYAFFQKVRENIEKANTLEDMVFQASRFTKTDNMKLVLDLAREKILDIVNNYEKELLAKIEAL